MVENQCRNGMIRCVIGVIIGLLYIIIPIVAGIVLYKFRNNSYFQIRGAFPFYYMGIYLFIL